MIAFPSYSTLQLLKPANRGNIKDPVYYKKRKVLLTSGFSKFRGMEPVDEESRILAENILSKPYNRQELASSVRRVLDGAA